MEAGKPFIQPEGGEDKKDYDAEEDKRRYRRGQDFTSLASGGYAVNKVGISVPDTHFSLSHFYLSFWFLTFLGIARLARNDS